MTNCLGHESRTHIAGHAISTHRLVLKQQGIDIKAGQDYKFGFVIKSARENRHLNKLEAGSKGI